MKRFKVQLRGENFLLDLDGDHGKFGFTTSRVIKASDPDEAKRIAIIQLHQELNRSANIIKNTLDAPKVYPLDIEPLNFFSFLVAKKPRGFEFINEENQQL